MSQILIVETSPQRSESFSNKLAAKIAASIVEVQPNSEIKIRDLTTNTPPLLTKLEFGTYSDEAVAEIKSADHIILSVPTHNFNVPTLLKAWIDQICRAGLTFSYSATGPKGLVTGKKVYLAIASGSIQTGQEATSPDVTEKYLKSLLGFIGMTDVQVFRVEGLAIPGVKESALDKGLASVAERLKL